MRHYCTLFDSKYLPQGLVLYESLKKHSSEPFTLYVLPMDNECADALLRMVLPNVQVIIGFHSAHPGMVEARANRSHQEYCWTCASNFAEAMLGLDLPEITYLDSDMMFFSDPKVIHDEIGERSIAVIPHRLIPSKKHLEVNGKFNVSWVTFKNNPIGRECLSAWARQCRDKCSATDGCGDQKYLDEWPDKYGDELCIIQNIGAGLAPWNLANYELINRAFILDENVPTIWIDRHDGRRSYKKVVFYHYHETRFNEDGGVTCLSYYYLRPEDVDLIYKPYIEAVKSVKARIQELTVNK